MSKSNKVTRANALPAPGAVPRRGTPMSRRLFAIVLLLIPVFFSACKQSPGLANRLQSAGGANALKTECLGFVAAYEASSGTQRNWHPGQTNFPPTIAALQPRVVQVGHQGNVVLVHLGFVTRPRPSGLYVAPKGCPSDFLPERPMGSRVQKLAEGVFEYKD
jgi:hypothetical protein